MVTLFSYRGEACSVRLLIVSILALDIDCASDKRREQIEKWDHASLISLDYMVYSVCEQCCDSIPANTVASEYEKRYETNQLYTADRGNAVAHAAYDVRGAI